MQASGSHGHDGDRKPEVAEFLVGQRATSGRQHVGRVSAPEHLSVSASGVRFGALAWGDPDAPLALLVHGYPDTAWTWRHLGPHRPSVAGGQWPRSPAATRQKTWHQMTAT